MRINLPNQITLGRFVLAIVFIVLLARFEWSAAPRPEWMLDVAFWLFVVAAASDFLDGYLAQHNQVTSFGRILDPFVDKILVGGAFVLFLGSGFMDRATGQNVTGLSAWMVVVIISRELLVSGLRGFSEAGGKPYAANWWGKIKMVIQSVTVGYILQSISGLRHIVWFVELRPYVLWITVIATAVSVYAYLAASREALSEHSRA